MKKAKAIYSELVISRESNFCFGRGMGKAYSEIKERLQVCPCWGLLACRRCKGASRNRGTSVVWLRMHIWLCMVGKPKTRQDIGSQD